MLMDASRRAALISDPSRAKMLERLMDGRAYTASELAKAAGIAPATASTHLARLEEGGLIEVAAQGRHRYVRLAGPEVATWLESLARAPVEPARSSCPPPLRFARVCYSHLAGHLSLEVLKALLDRAYLMPHQEDFAMVPEARERWAALGVDPSMPLQGRACMDWSERRPHLGGPLGSALLKAWLERGWLQRVAGSRALQVTHPGARALKEALGLRGL